MRFSQYVHDESRVAFFGASEWSPILRNWTFSLFEETSLVSCFRWPWLQDRFDNPPRRRMLNSRHETLNLFDCICSGVAAAVRVACFVGIWLYVGDVFVHGISSAYSYNPGIDKEGMKCCCSFWLLDPNAPQHRSVIQLKFLGSTPERDVAHILTFLKKASKVRTCVSLLHANAWVSENILLMPQALCVISCCTPFGLSWSQDIAYRFVFMRLKCWRVLLGINSDRWTSTPRCDERVFLIVLTFRTTIYPVASTFRCFSVVRMRLFLLIWCWSI